jgi:uncharacterized protein (DUF1330 family)
MKFVNELYPKAEQLAPLLDDGSAAPICMLNLLRFRDKAEYPDGRATNLSGREAYMLYANPMRRIVEGNGGKFLFSGNIGAVVVGEVEDPWDVIGVVQYPSRADFHRIATSPEVQEIGVHRTAGLAGQLLLLTEALDL